MVHLVKNTKSEGEGSFREALELSNADATRAHVIRFALPEAEAVIRPKDPFPEVKASVEIDGSVDLDRRPSVTIDGNDAGQASGLTLAGPPPSTIRGLFITGFKGSGVVLHGEGTHLVERCAIYDSSDRGVIVTSDHCVLRMLEVCGNSNGGIIVVGAKGARIQGCRIGVTCTGEEHGNGTSGVYIAQAPGNSIGPENTISGNHHYGVLIYGSKSRENHVFGNLIGTDPQGNSAIPNLRTGVLIFNAPDNVIGGIRSDSRKIISGNRRNGINIDGSATRPELDGGNPDKFTEQGGCGFAIGNTVCGNFVGTDLSGTTALPNGKHGILIFVAQGNFVGGASPGHANVISGNKEHGIFVL
ncbi:MAG: right-handed parallel beta-helix repeat-containing protein, partial [Pseudomonadota bacterium]